MEERNRNSGESASQDFANNAVLSLAESTADDIDAFIRFIDDNQFAPVARIKGLPVYRLRDYNANRRCYIVNELSPMPTEVPAKLEYTILGSYLVFCDADAVVNSVPEKYMVSLEIINAATNGVSVQPLTPAELRLAAQMVCGMELKAAADNDNVSIETKRSQLKAITAKLGVSRQQDLLRLLLPAMAHLTNPASWDKTGQRLLNRYAADYLPADVCCHSLSDHQGKSVRIIDYGPVRGKPVLMLHSMIFPDITAEDVQLAQELGLRLIWPLRPGLFEAKPELMSSAQYCDEVIEGIELAWEHLCGEPVPLIAMVSSAWHAVAFAKRHPPRVKHITFAATCFSAGRYDNSIRYFGSSVAELCSRNTWLMSKTVDFLRKSMHDTNRFAATIKQVFRKSAPDIRVLKRECDSVNHGQRLRTAIVDSPESIKHDYFNQVHFNWSTVTNLMMPVQFIHGAQDSLHPVSDLKKLLAGISGPPLVVFEEAGHIMQYEHFHRLIRECVESWEKH